MAGHQRDPASFHMLKATRNMRWGSTRVGRVLLVACVVNVAGVSAAEDIPPTPASMRVRLLDEVPDYATVLRNQWSTTVRPETFEREAGHYGLLTETNAPRPITLEESISLALQNNTGLRIQQLN